MRMQDGKPVTHDGRRDLHPSENICDPWYIVPQIFVWDERGSVWEQRWLLRAPPITPRSVWILKELLSVWGFSICSSGPASHYKLNLPASSWWSICCAFSLGFCFPSMFYYLTYKLRWNNVVFFYHVNSWMTAYYKNPDVKSYDNDATFTLTYVSVRLCSSTSVPLKCHNTGHIYEKSRFLTVFPQCFGMAADSTYNPRGPLFDELGKRLKKQIS